MPQTPLFLERRSYRRRRMMDAVRLLPLLGLALWMVPMLWAVPDADGQGDAMPMAAALRYVFGIWIAMVLAALLLWWRTRRPAVATPADSAPSDPQSEAR